MCHPSTCVRNLGVMFDTGFTVEQLVSGIRKSSGLPIRNVGKIVKCLTPRAAEQFVHSLITSRLDGCHSLQFRINKRQLRRQQNTASRSMTLNEEARIHKTSTDISALVTNRRKYNVIVFMITPLQRNNLPQSVRQCGITSTFKKALKTHIF